MEVGQKRHMPDQYVTAPHTESPQRFSASEAAPWKGETVMFVINY